MITWKKKLRTVLLAIVCQFIFAGFIFVGFLLDPLLGIWVAGIYFFVIGSFLMYGCLINAASCETFPYNKQFNERMSTLTKF